MKMAQYGICYDLDTKAMKADGFTDSEIAATYQVELVKALNRCGLTKHLQYSMHATEDNENALATIMKMPPQLRKLAPRFCKYVKRFLVVRIEDWGNITDLFKEDEEQAA
jgi:virulence-associated protein VapD